MPPLPATLTALNCSECTELRILPALPAALEWLSISEGARLPDASIPGVVHMSGNYDAGVAATWRWRIWQRHVADRQHVAKLLPAPALLYV